MGCVSSMVLRSVVSPGSVSGMPYCVLTDPEGQTLKEQTLASSSLIAPETPSGKRGVSLVSLECGILPFPVSDRFGTLPGAALGRAGNGLLCNNLWFKSFVPTKRKTSFLQIHYKLNESCLPSDALSQILLHFI